ncbi:DUF523 domain-containing protein [Desnuesiella massiliensis]|uniref:DUF523 domain-containing protein n=1 Tax=Desnuesiella massiliensis TaxID=1650662 RepID=UPI0006E29748|nr:DUF523 domain-containing protein [Desnuesiella massiliensis]
MILVSACLCGINCKYNARNNYNENIYNLLEKGEAIPVCPEQLGGLTTPRACAEIVGGEGKDVLLNKAKVMNKDCLDLTGNFIKGAMETLKIAKALKVEKAILKSNSPSCGRGIIYDGSFSNKKIKGNGVTAELLLQEGIEVITEEDL